MEGSELAGMISGTPGPGTAGMGERPQGWADPAPAPGAGSGPEDQGGPPAGLPQRAPGSFACPACGGALARRPWGWICPRCGFHPT